MDPFVQHKTYEETITDPRDGEEWKVTFRVLNAGDDAAIRDETVIETDVDETGTEVERSRVPMGRLRLLVVERAVVTWTLPLPKSRAAIEALHDGIFSQIYAKVRFASSGDGRDEDGPPTEAQTGDESPAPSGAEES